MYVNVTCEKRHQVLSHYCTASNESWGAGGGGLGIRLPYRLYNIRDLEIPGSLPLYRTTSSMEKR